MYLYTSLTQSRRLTYTYDIEPKHSMYLPNGGKSVVKPAQTQICISIVEGKTLTETNPM